ncbi:MAG: hypothetical protein R3Y54_02145 [Eubacteriales bacterium]
MKRISIMLIAIFALSITALLFIFLDKPKEYIFTSPPINAQNWVTLYDGTDSCNEIYLNENGDLVMVLTSEQKKDFLKYDITTAGGISSTGTTLTFSNNYKTLEIVGEQGQLNIESSIRTAIFNAQFNQVLRSGTSDWQLEVILKDRNTGSTLQTFFLPNEPFIWNY